MSSPCCVKSGAAARYDLSSEETRMKTIFDRDARGELTRRVASIRGTEQARWGRMNAAQMISHIEASARMAIGEITAKPKWTPFKWGPIRRLVICRLPFPKGAPTAPELLLPALLPLDELKENLVRHMEALAARGAEGDWPEHAAFGHATGFEWGVLLYRHMDHHLRQFGA
jgi:hypothetical protein